MEAMDYTYPENQKPLSPGQYALYAFLASIPLIGLILLLVWAFSAGGNIHQRNWAKGMLLLMVIGYLLIIVFFALAVGLGAMSGIFSNF